MKTLFFGLGLLLSTSSFAGERFAILASDLNSYSSFWPAISLGNQLPSEVSRDQSYYTVYTAGINTSLSKAAVELKVIAKTIMVESSTQQEATGLVVEAVPAQQNWYMLIGKLQNHTGGLTELYGADFGIIDGKITSYFPNGKNINVDPSQVQVVGKLPKNPGLAVTGNIAIVNH